ncbi:hypothetical protein BDR05DRAFT_710309 [Suillus weaverae]|nr:hypothetical protein BDR05DRAFT_710309 [Suillus weaverae]
MDDTARLWNLENGQPISSPLQHADQVNCLSFSVDGKRLATGCNDKNAYIWDVAAIVKEAGLDDLLSDPKTNMSALHQRPLTYRPGVPQGFFDGVPPAHSSARSRPHPPGSTFLSRLFHRSPSSAHDISPSSPLDWARNLLKRRGRSGEGIELQGRSPAVVDVPYAKGKRRDACAREQRRPIHLPSKSTTAGSFQPLKPNVAKPFSQPQAVSSSSTTPDFGDAAATTSTTPSYPYAMIRHPGLWTRFWLFIGCISPEYTDDRH